MAFDGKYIKQEPISPRSSPVISAITPSISGSDRSDGSLSPLSKEVLGIIKQEQEEEQEVEQEQELEPPRPWRSWRSTRTCTAEPDLLQPDRTWLDDWQRAEEGMNDTITVQVPTARRISGISAQHIKAWEAKLGCAVGKAELDGEVDVDPNGNATASFELPPDRASPMSDEAVTFKQESSSPRIWSEPEHDVDTDTAEVPMAGTPPWDMLELLEPPLHEASTASRSKSAQKPLATDDQQQGETTASSSQVNTASTQDHEQDDPDEEAKRLSSRLKEIMSVQAVCWPTDSMDIDSLHQAGTVSSSSPADGEGMIRQAPQWSYRSKQPSKQVAYLADSVSARTSLETFANLIQKRMQGNPSIVNGQWVGSRKMGSNDPLSVFFRDVTPDHEDTTEEIRRHRRATDRASNWAQRNWHIISRKTAVVLRTANETCQTTRDTRRIRARLYARRYRARLRASKAGSSMDSKQAFVVATSGAGDDIACQYTNQGGAYTKNGTGVDDDDDDDDHIDFEVETPPPTYIPETIASRRSEARDEHS